MSDPIRPDDNTCLVTGQYFKRAQPVESAPESYDADVAARLWVTSAALVGLTPDVPSSPTNAVTPGLKLLGHGTGRVHRRATLAHLARRYD